MLSSRALPDTTVRVLHVIWLALCAEAPKRPSAMQHYAHFVGEAHAVPYCCLQTCLVHCNHAIMRDCGRQAVAAGGPKSLLASQSKPGKTSPACARRVLCAGHSLGAAIATLCGPWAKATFPNVRLPSVTAAWNKRDNSHSCMQLDTLYVRSCIRVQKVSQSATLGTPGLLIDINPGATCASPFRT